MVKLEEAAREAPRDVTIRRDLINRRGEAVRQQLDIAQEKLEASDYDAAEAAFSHALKIDRNLASARNGLDEVEQARRLDGMNREAARLAKQGRPDRALELTNRVMAERPGDTDAVRLKQAMEREEASRLAVAQSLTGLYQKPISLEFRDVPIQQALEALARTTNISFVFDKEVRPDLRATLFLREAMLEDAVNVLLVSNRLEKKILNERSILIYPADPAKIKEYQDLVVRAFYLDYADAKQLATTLKTLLKVREAIPDEKLNMIIMRDTPETIAVAERIVALYELPDPEVMLEVEVLEVTRTTLLDLGIQWPSQATFTPLSASGAATTTLADLKCLNDSRIQVSVGSVTAKLDKTDSDVNLRANPRIRVRNKSKAKILIGDKVPIITTTSTATGFVSESVQYVDVGLKLEVEPRVTLKDDVSIWIGLEVSSLVKEVSSGGGTLAYQIGTRNADTLLTLHDGETQILAGLLNDEERSSGTRIPLLGDVPLLGRLFGSQKDERAKTEIILSITPRIVQNARRPPLETAQFWSGSEAAVRTRPLALPSVSRGAGEARIDAAAAAAAGHGLAAETAYSTPAATHAVEFDWSAPATAKVGEIVTVSLQLRTDGALRSLPFQVGFDPAAVDILNVEAGGLFRTETGQTGLSTNIDNAGGRVFASITPGNAEGAASEGTVAIFAVRAKTPGKPIEFKLLGATPIGPNNQVLALQRLPPLSIPVTP